MRAHRPFLFTSHGFWSSAWRRVCAMYVNFAAASYSKDRHIATQTHTHIDIHKLRYARHHKAILSHHPRQYVYPIGKGPIERRDTDIHFFFTKIVYTVRRLCCVHFVSFVYLLF